MANPSYTCDEVDNAFYQQSGLISGDLAMRYSPRGRWRKMFQFKKWDDGMGLIHNVMNFERTVPANTGTEWVDNQDSSNITGDQCTPTPEIINFGQTLRQFRRQQRNIQTNWFCLEDLRDDYKISTMLGALQKNLGWVSHYVLENRIQDEYERLSEHKVTENASFDIEATSFSGANPPSSKLLQGTLDQIYQYMVADGAAEEGGIGITDAGMSVLTLFTDMNTSIDLVRQDPELRMDFRYDPDKVKLLTQPFGMPRAVGNFKHVYNPFQPRYEISGGNFVRVQPFKDPTTSGVTKGFKQPIRKEYIYATYSKSYVVISSAMDIHVPAPITSPGGGMHFDPVNYMGDFQWLNIRDVKCNPRGTKGFFDALFTTASAPGETWYAFSILHLNCPPQRKGLDCYEYEKFG